MNRLGELRNQKGYSQQKLSSILNVSRSTVAMWETEKAEPNSEMLVKLANIFDVSVDYMLGRTDEPRPLSLDEQMEGIEFALYGEVKDLTDEQKQEILDYVRFKKQQGK